MRLQNPSVRPSMIGRAVVANGTLATTTSWSRRPWASVSPTWAYTGSVKLPIGCRWPEGGPAVLHRVGDGKVAVLHRVRHEHEPAGDVPGGNDVRGGGAQLLIDLHAPCVVSPASDLHEASDPELVAWSAATSAVSESCPTMAF
jgi:hypothetical protein